jgi:hypothetical protein
MGSFFPLSGQVSQQITHTQYKFAWTQNGDVGVAGLKMAQIKRH